jgi:hypothetical protein
MPILSFLFIFVFGNPARSSPIPRPLCNPKAALIKGYLFQEDSTANEREWPLMKKKSEPPGSDRRQGRIWFQIDETKLAFAEHHS